MFTGSEFADPEFADLVLPKACSQLSRRRPKPETSGAEGVRSRRRPKPNSPQPFPSVTSDTHNSVMPYPFQDFLVSLEQASRALSNKTLTESRSMHNPQVVQNEHRSSLEQHQDSSIDVWHISKLWAFVKLGLLHKRQEANLLLR
ncbi:hypothetical protein AXG93_2543s1050 [Marchantia polymorpha subsp. ruderalis]|uniref:Uncharacterized protein n=1 Tax=Marchantia polymorpha subsp. ruderalis TaxID=1480154 RepID=A0A176VNZ9_MARPO|nr:hypothetical protein AXG93_2543s1050 [Marchantia polymorpha subsp. ruderalis]